MGEAFHENSPDFAPECFFGSGTQGRQLGACFVQHEDLTRGHVVFALFQEHRSYRVEAVRREAILSLDFFHHVHVDSSLRIREVEFLFPVRTATPFYLLCWRRDSVQSSDLAKLARNPRHCGALQQVGPVETVDVVAHEHVWVALSDECRKGQQQLTFG